MQKKPEPIEPSHQIAYDLYAEAVNFCQQHDFSFSSIRVWVLPFGYKETQEGKEADVYEHQEGRWETVKRRLWPVNPHPQLHQLRCIRSWVEVTDVPNGLAGVPLSERPDYFSIEISCWVLGPTKKEKLIYLPATDDGYLTLLKRHVKGFLIRSRIANLPGIIENLDRKVTIYVGGREATWDQLRAIPPESSVTLSEEDARAPLALYRRSVDDSAEVRMVIPTQWEWGQPRQQEFRV